MHRQFIGFAVLVKLSKKYEINNRYLDYVKSTRSFCTYIHVIISIVAVAHISVQLSTTVRGIQYVALPCPKNFV